MPLAHSMEADEVLLALYAVRADMESKAGLSASLVLRDYFMYPSLFVPVEWPTSWRELAHANARLGRAAGRSGLIPLKDG